MLFLQNKEKKIFIRPGCEVHVGRAKECQIHLSNPSVSKKHAVLKVDPISVEVALDIGAIPVIRLTDISTGGTSVDGARANKTATALRLGAILHFALDPEPWKLVYEPIAVTLSIGLKKENIMQKLLPHAEKLGPLGFKVIAEYVSITKLVITKKRNTGKSLQALVNGEKIANYEYINFLVEAFPAFNGVHLPPIAEFLPTDTEDDAALFDANPRRKTLFAGHSFIFFSAIQYANLAPCILSGEGKAKKLEQLPGVKEIQAVSPSGVTVLVLPLEDSAAVLKLAEEAGLATIVQNKFLSLILYCDFSILEKQFRRESSLELAKKVEPASGSSMKRSAEEEPQPQALKKFKSRKLRASTVFDDIFGVQKDDKTESPIPVDGAQESLLKNTTSIQQMEGSPRENVRESSSEPEVVFKGMEVATRLHKQAKSPSSAAPIGEENAESLEDDKPTRMAKGKGKLKANKDQLPVEDAKKEEPSNPVQEYDYAEFAHLKNLGRVETFALTRTPVQRRQRGDWNGRKNFKGFQRANGQRTVRAAPHFVGFVESKSNRFDIAPSEAPVSRKGSRLGNGGLYAQQTLLDDYPGPRKQQTQVVAVDESGSESDEDELRFKFT